MGLGIQTLEIEKLLESNPLRSGFLVRGLTARNNLEAHLTILLIYQTF